jgi:hypothetical protein
MVKLELRSDGTLGTGWVTEYAKGWKANQRIKHRERRHRRNVLQQGIREDKCKTLTIPRVGNSGEQKLDTGKHGRYFAHKN